MKRKLLVFWKFGVFFHFEVHKVKFVTLIQTFFQRIIEFTNLCCPEKWKMTHLGSSKNDPCSKYTMQLYSYLPHFCFLDISKTTCYHSFVAMLV